MADTYAQTVADARAEPGCFTTEAHRVAVAELLA